MLSILLIFFLGPITHATNTDLRINITGIECNLQEIYSGADPATVDIPAYCNNAPSYTPTELPVSPKQASSVLDVYGPNTDLPLIPNTMLQYRLDQTSGSSLLLVDGVRRIPSFPWAFIILLIALFILLLLPLRKRERHTHTSRSN